jgi:outer membrane immunogenic protein
MPYSVNGFAALAESDVRQTGRLGPRFPAVCVEKSEEVPIMTQFLKFGAATVALVLGATAASAADFGAPAPPYTPPPAYTATAFNWAGPYVGLLGGYGWANFNDGAGTTGNGWLAGGYLGYNWQVDSWVYGVEADAMWSGIRGTSAGNTHELDYLATVRGRLGVAVDNFLFYGTAGAAIAGGTSTPAPSSSRTHTGWVVGAGVEAALTESVTGRVEYNYVDLNTRGYANGTVASPNAHVVKIGLGIKF